MLQRPLGNTRLFLFFLVAVVMLCTESRLAWVGSQQEFNQMISRSDLLPGTKATIGATLSVYITEGERLAPGFRHDLKRALRALEVPFDRVEFHTTLPEEVSGPVLLVRLERATSLWSPVYASRQVAASLHYTHGLAVPRERAEAVLSGRELQAGIDQGCTVPCADGHKRLTVGSTAVGLITLPALKGNATATLATEAAKLVQAGLPEYMNPDKWFERASKLAENRWAGGTSRWTSFKRLEGCRGGVVTSGTNGDWAAAYYDADQDTLRDAVSRDDLIPLVRQRPGMEQFDPEHPIGIGERGLFLLLGAKVDGKESIFLPFEGCGLGAWRLESWEAITP